MMYDFIITICGSGDNADDAWRDAAEGFALDPGCTPEDYEETED